MNKQSERTARYQAKIGLTPKTYKLYKTLTDEFASVCRANGASQASVLSDLMHDYISGYRPPNQQVN